MLLGRLFEGKYSYEKGARTKQGKGTRNECMKRGNRERNERNMRTRAESKRFVVNISVLKLILQVPGC